MAVVAAPLLFHRELDMATDAFETLVAESKSVGWPTCYRDDLYVHDRSALEENKPVKFVWLLRECGTDLCIPDSLLGFSVLSYNARYNNMISDRRVYIYDRGQLRDATYQQAWDFLYAASHKCIRQYVGTVANAPNTEYRWRTTNWIEVYEQLDREIACQVY